DGAPACISAASSIERCTFRSRISTWPEPVEAPAGTVRITGSQKDGRGTTVPDALVVGYSRPPVASMTDGRPLIVAEAEVAIVRHGPARSPKRAMRFALIRTLISGIADDACS